MKKKSSPILFINEDINIDSQDHDDNKKEEDKIEKEPEKKDNTKNEKKDENLGQKIELKNEKSEKSDSFGFVEISKDNLYIDNDQDDF